jgi:putative chitinase
MNLADKYKSLLEKNDVVSPLRKAHFFAQIEHESRLVPISENLNYSSSGLMKTFKKYFPTEELALIYARNPEKIANRVYANRMENGDEASGDGWKYRGRGFIQLTGKNNYKNLSHDVKIDYLSEPDKLLTEVDAMIAALWYWNRNNLNTYADQDDINQITKRINGGYNGLEDRKRLLNKYKVLFNT